MIGGHLLPLIPCDKAIGIGLITLYFMTAMFFNRDLIRTSFAARISFTIAWALYVVFVLLLL